MVTAFLFLITAKIIQYLEWAYKKHIRKTVLYNFSAYTQWNKIHKLYK